MNLRRHARAWLAILMALGVAASASAAISAYEPKLADALAQGDEAAVEKIATTLRAAKSPTLETRNDLAATQIFLGEYDVAIEGLRTAETSAPGKSVKVANNLGAAFERKGGNDEEALYWIREAYKRDANEHEGSGWLHLRMLEAKVAAERDPKWFEKNTILSYDFGAEEEPVAPGILPVDKDGKIKGVDDLLADIAFQIEERQRFVQAPDPVIADLAASAGDLVYAGTDGNPAKHYELALRYGTAKADLVRKRLERFRRLYPHVQAEEDAAAQATRIAATRAEALRELQERRATRRKMYWIGGGVLTVLVILGAGWMFDRYRRRKAGPPLPEIDYDAIDSLRKP
jgi:tetratricopeptide (TPR) repeat protein